MRFLERVAEENKALCEKLMPAIRFLLRSSKEERAARVHDQLIGLRMAERLIPLLQSSLPESEEVGPTVKEVLFFNFIDLDPELEQQVKQTTAVLKLPGRGNSGSQRLLQLTA